MQPPPTELRSSPRIVEGESLARVATITVTFNPDIEILREQLDQIPRQVMKVLVDNASATELLAGVRALVAGRDDVLLVENPENVGLAVALNQGARHAQGAAPNCAYLLMLDQDTEPGEQGVSDLFDAYQALAATHPRLACIGPRLVDVATGLDHGFHQIKGWCWTQRFFRAGPPLAVDNLNGSGTLVSVAVFNQIGGLDETFFIDHVDTDWAFRVLAAGFELFGVPEVQFRHRMGATGIRYWFFGWRVWPYRSPLRHYYLFRNTVWLLRRSHVPAVWKAWAPVKLLVTLVVHLVFDSNRWAQARQMLAGLQGGIDERTGARAPARP